MSVFLPAEIYLPSSNVDFYKWAVIACDQFTSQPEYWERVEREVGDAPSTLRMIYPEAYLESDSAVEHEVKIGKIHETMESYLKEGILMPMVADGFILTARETDAGTRIGLIGKLDLEFYDYNGSAADPVRATEMTVKTRIPTRMGVRQGGALEMPHIMMLMDDAEGLIDRIYRNRDNYTKVYETPLMFEGGSVSGYAIEGEAAKAVAKALSDKEESSIIFLAAGDGNHSLAAAKACWEELKEKLPEEARKNHPARYALVEVVDLYSDSLNFEPIHRVMFETELSDLIPEFRDYLKNRDVELTETEDTNRADLTVISAESRTGYLLSGRGNHLPVELLQQFLDGYLEKRPYASIDYVHSEEAVEAFAKSGRVCGILLPVLDKTELFPAIDAGGVLPRKTFSIGKEHQKRYYMECRRIN